MAAPISYSVLPHSYGSLKKKAREHNTKPIMDGLDLFQYVASQVWPLTPS